MRAIGSSNFAAAARRGGARDGGRAGSDPVRERAERVLVGRSARPRRSCCPSASGSGSAFIPYFPLASGLLTGKYRRGEPAPEGTRLARARARRRPRSRASSARDVGTRARRLAARSRDRRARRAARRRLGDRGRDEAGAGSRERRGRRVGADARRSSSRSAPSAARRQRLPESSSRQQPAGLADGVRAQVVAVRARVAADDHEPRRAELPEWWCAVDFASPVSSVSSFSDASPCASRCRILIRRRRRAPGRALAPAPARRARPRPAPRPGSR